MNHGTSLVRPGRAGAAGASAACGRRGAISENTTTTGPSIRTRTSLTRVPTWVDSRLTGTVAASTCGTA